MCSLPCKQSEVDLFLSEPSEEVIEALRGVSGDILVLGAGGKMGLHVALMLERAIRSLGKSNRISAVSRFSSPHRQAEFREHGIPTVSCDLSRVEEVDRLPECEALFYLAGVKFGTSSNPEELHRTNVSAPNLVAVRFRAARVVAFSTGCVYPFVSVESGGSWETDLPQPIGDYAESCLHREEQFSKTSQEYGTRCSIIRLNYSVEFRYGVLVDIAEKVMRREAVDLSMGFVNVIWQNDAIAQVIGSLEYADSPPFIVNVAGAETLSVRELAAKFGKILGREPIYTGEEADTAWLSNATRSHNLFGPPKVGIEEMIDWTAKWLLEGGQVWGKPTHFERRDGRY